MFAWYRRLCGTQGYSPPKGGLTWILGIGSVAVPVFISLGVYDPRIAFITLGICGSLLGLILFYNTKLFLVFIVPLIYIVPHYRLLQIMAIVVVISFVAAKLSSDKISIRVPHFYLILLLVSVAAYGTIRGFDDVKAMNYFQLCFVIPVLLFIIYNNLDISVHWMRVNLLTICGIVSLVGWISLLMYLQSGIPRSIFNWGSQNSAANIFGLLLPYSLIQLIDAGKTRARVVWLSIFVGILVGVFLTQTRAVYLSVFIAAIYLGINDRRVMQIFFPAIALGIIAVPALIIERMAMLFGSGVTPDWSSVGRIQIYMNSLQMLPESFLFGFGMGNFRKLYAIQFPDSFILAEHAHIIYVRWIFDFGILGCIAYAAIIYLILSRAIKAFQVRSRKGQDGVSRMMLGLSGGILSLLTAALFDTPLYSAQVAVLFWTMLAFLLILTQQERGGLA